jgi:hypothetical protein
MVILKGNCGIWLGFEVSRGSAEVSRVIRRSAGSAESQPKTWYIAYDECAHILLRSGVYKIKNDLGSRSIQSRSRALTKGGSRVKPYRSSYTEIQVFESPIPCRIVQKSGVEWW